MANKLLSRRFWHPILGSLFLIATGADLLIFYLFVKRTQLDDLKSIDDTIRLIWFLLLIAWSATSPARKSDLNEPSPARSGTGVILATGVGAAIFSAHGASWPDGFMLPAAILITTSGIALVVYRFASKHAPDIGEARFDTAAGSRKPLS